MIWQLYMTCFYTCILPKALFVIAYRALIRRESEPRIFAVDIPNDSY